MSKRLNGLDGSASRLVLQGGHRGGRDGCDWRLIIEHKPDRPRAIAASAAGALIALSRASKCAVARYLIESEHMPANDVPSIRIRFSVNATSIFTSCPSPLDTRCRLARAAYVRTVRIGHSVVIHQVAADGCAVHVP